ncbi:MAG: HD domain-containing phosphohydrolase [Bacillota bacterium]|nr:HD domain-containing phosphohydrolase [Bacillota bacterium]
MTASNLDSIMTTNKCGEIFEALSLIMSIGESHPLEHGQHVALLTWRLLQELNIRENQLDLDPGYWWYGALLHDLGEIYLSDTLLFKSGYLTDKERKELEQHPIYGEKLINRIPQLKPVGKIVRWHHERWDGSGYPDKLKGEEIPLSVQVVGLADCLSALSAKRVHRPPLTHKEILAELKRMTDRKFNGVLVHQAASTIRKNRDWLDFIPDEYSKLSKKISSSIFTDNCSLPIFQEAEHGIKLLSKVIDTKHLYTKEHSKRVSKYSVLLAEALGLSGEEIKKCRVAGLLHDAGKVAVPSNILDKPGKLSAAEYKTIQGHPEMSYIILNTMSNYRDIALYSKHHHERYDGSGYPNGLRAERIPLISRIIGVVDAYDAMTSDRSYRSALTHEVAMKEIANNAGTQFDPEVAFCFCRMHEQFI